MLIRCQQLWSNGTLQVFTAYRYILAFFRCMHNPADQNTGPVCRRLIYLYGVFSALGMTRGDMLYSAKRHCIVDPYNAAIRQQISKIKTRYRLDLGGNVQVLNFAKEFLGGIETLAIS